MKYCIRCERDLPLSDFNRDRTTSDGYYPFCRSCRHAAYERNKDRIQIQHREYRNAHKEEARENLRRFHEAHPDYKREYNRRYRQDQTHADAERARKQTPESRLQKKIHRLLTQEHDREVQAAWGQANKAKWRAYAANRRALKTGAGGEFTDAEWEALKAQYDHRCLCCGLAEPVIALHADHVIPIRKGGTSDIGNIQPLCAFCNFSKHDAIHDYR